MHTFTIALISTLSLSVYAASIGDSISQLVTREQHNRQFHHNPDFASDNNLPAAESFERSGKKSPRDQADFVASGEMLATGNTVPQAAAGVPVIANSQTAANNQAVANNQAQAAPLIALAQAASPFRALDPASWLANNLASLPANNVASAPPVLSNPVRPGATSDSSFVAIGASSGLSLADNLVPLKRQAPSLTAPDLPAPTGSLPTGSLPAAPLPIGSVATTLPIKDALANLSPATPSNTGVTRRDDSMESSNGQDGDMNFLVHEAYESEDFEEGS